MNLIYQDLINSFTNGGVDRRLIDFAYDPSVYRLPITMLSGTGSTVNGDPGNVINVKLLNFKAMEY